MNMNRKITALFPLILAIIISGCGGGGGGGGAGTTLPKFKSGDNEITDFRFAAVKNGDGFSADSTGEISGNSITVYSPLWYRCHITGGGFVTNSTVVEVNDVLQLW